MREKRFDLTVAKTRALFFSSWSRMAKLAKLAKHESREENTNSGKMKQWWRYITRINRSLGSWCSRLKWVNTHFFFQGPPLMHSASRATLLGGQRFSWSSESKTIRPQWIGMRVRISSSSKWFLNKDDQANLSNSFALINRNCTPACVRIRLRNSIFQKNQARNCSASQLKHAAASKPFKIDPNLCRPWANWFQDLIIVKWLWLTDHGFWLIIISNYGNWFRIFDLSCST